MGLLSFRLNRQHSGPASEANRIREKLFVEHYQSLLAHALRFTHGERERAEDLVHDCFVQFQVKQVDVLLIEDLRAYLFGIVRNLYLLQIRRATRHPVHQLSILDHDTADLGLRSQSPIDQFQCIDSLVGACHFVCFRKEESISASILILRFFHGFYIDEICLIADMQRRQVNKWLAIGREEAKKFILEPYTLPPFKMSWQELPDPSSRTFLASLRRTIFDSCTRPCPISNVDPQATAIEALAHLVSCPACLEYRSGNLGLPTSSGRMMDDISAGNDKRGRRSKEVKPSFSKELRRACHDRVRQLFEHHPTELSVTFDGETHATLLVNAALNTLHLSIEAKQCPDSIAVLSEQEVCLILLDRTELASEMPKFYSVPLSEDRSLEVVITPEFRGPSLQVIYRDPTLATALSPHLSRPVYTDQKPSSQSSSLITGRWKTGDGWLSGVAASLLESWRKLRRFFSKLKLPLMNPLLATAAALAVVATILFIAGLQQQRNRRTVTDLMRRAVAADTSFRVSTQPGVLYQNVKIQAGRQSITRTIYRDAQRKRPLKMKEDPGNEQLIQRLAGAGVSWDLPLSSIGYMSWHDRQQDSSDTVSRADGRVIVLTTMVSGDSEVEKESLTIRADDLRPIARSIAFRDNETVEIAELTYGDLPWGPALDRLFEPASASPHLSTNADQWGARPAAFMKLRHHLSEAEFDEAELSARLALRKIGADTTERIEIVRSPYSVQVRGVVAGDEKKQLIEESLRVIPNVVPGIFTFEELERRAKADSAATTVSLVSVTEGRSPLNLYLGEKGKSLEEIRQTELKLSNASVIVNRESNAIADLLSRYGTRSDLNTNSKDALDSLLRDHKLVLLTAIEQEASLLRDSELLSDEDRLPMHASTLPPHTMVDLIDAAQQSNTHLAEMLSGTNESPRSASAIAPELERAIANLHAAVIAVQESPWAEHTTLKPLSLPTAKQ